MKERNTWHLAASRRRTVGYKNIDLMVYLCYAMEKIDYPVNI